MFHKSLFPVILLAFLVACQNSRPGGTEVEVFLEHLNKVSKPLPKGDHNEYYALLSNDFIAKFEKEIDKARNMDSIDLRNLPPMEMLRILSLKNAYVGTLKQRDNKRVLIEWLGSSGKGFPLQNADRFYYSPKASIESKMLKDGVTYPQVLILEEEEGLRVNPLNTEAYQQKRLENILKKITMDQLIKEAAWMHFQVDRTINWGPIG